MDCHFIFNFFFKLTILYMNSLSTQNGTIAPTRVAPYKGSPNAAASQKTAEATNKLSQLNKTVGGATTAPVKVNVIQPLYSDTFTGNQSVVGQQVGNASTIQQAAVQSQGDKTTLVVPSSNTTTGGRRKHKRKKRKTMKKKRAKKSFGRQRQKRV
jgi:hypothetical protein